MRCELCNDNIVRGIAYNNGTDTICEDCFDMMVEVEISNGEIVNEEE